MKTVFEKDFFKWENLRTTWEYKSLKFIFRFFVAGAVLMYILYSSAFAWKWMQMKWIRAQDIAQIETVFKQAIRKDDFGWAKTWMALRPKKDIPAILTEIEKQSAGIPAAIFMAAASRARSLDDKALADDDFWRMLARYRMRYDLLRCGNPEVVSKVNEVINMLEILLVSQGEKVKKQDNPAPLIRRVLDFDAKYPMHNSPAATCEMMKSMGTVRAVPEAEWAPVRHTLRVITEDALVQMEGGAKAP